MSGAPLLTTLVSGYYILRFEESISALDQWQWIVIFTVSVVTMALAITPTTYIALVGGYFLGIEAAFYVVAAYQLASALGYFLTKALNSSFIRDLIELFPNTKAYVNSIGKNQISTTILARLSPALPFAMMNVTLSIANINMRSFFLAGFIGMLPRTLFFIWLGGQAHHLESALNQNQGLIWSLGLTLLLVYVMYRILKPKA